MTSDHAPTSGRKADPPGLPTSAPTGPHATPYRMTVSTALDFDDAVALVDQALAVWLKEEGHDEPPPARFGPGAERVRFGDRVLLDRDSGPLPDVGARTAAGGAPDRPSATGPSDRVPPTGTGAGGPGTRAPDSGGPVGRYARRRVRIPVPHGAQQLVITLASDPAAGSRGRPVESDPAAPAPGAVRIRLEADHHASGPGLRSAGRVPVPGIVHRLLPLLDAVDGPSRIAVRPRVVTPDGVDDLIDELCDPERRLAAVVASVPSAVPFDDWLAEHVSPVLRQLTGLASLHVLSPAALPLFNVALEFHKVYGGAVRTYLPEVDPASRADAGRHQVLPRNRIEEDVRRAAALLAREPRAVAADVIVPAPLAAVPDLVLPPEARRPSRPATRAAEVRSAEPRRSDAARRTSPRAGRSGSRLCTGGGLTVPGRCLPDVGSALPAGAALTAPAEAEFARLAGEAGAGKCVVPGSFGELVGRFDEFPLLEFTGDQDKTLALDGKPDGSGWARLTWDGLTALQEYADAAVRGEAGGDFKQWCEHTPPGCHHFPPRKAVRWESRTVESHTKWKRERMLPVPACVDSSRRVFMGAHLRIGGGSTAPRLHYLDDCSGSGRIYVGYIGQHLTNTRTN